MTAMLWMVANDAELRNHIREQDSRFQTAMRRELMIMAAEQGKVLAPSVAPKPAYQRKRKPQDVLAIRQAPPADIPISDAHRIMREVCEKHGLTKAELLSARRDVTIVAARQEAMYRMSKETSMSMPAIGMRLGRDHTTVIYGVRKHAERLAAL